MGKNIGIEMNFSSRYIITTVILSFIFWNVALSQLQSGSSIGGLAGAPMRMGFGARGIAL
jgi:hypothetical protein